MSYKKILIGIIIVILILLVIFNTNLNSKEKRTIEVYKTEECSCCSKYIRYLEYNNFDVDVTILSLKEMDEFKQKHNISKELSSCHTSIIDDYFVEGHVPIESIDKLLNKKPDIYGISLPNMPLGSPGMPGDKKGPFIIKSIDYNLNIEVFEKR